MAVKKDPHTNLDFVLKNLLAGGKYYLQLFVMSSICDRDPELNLEILQFFLRQCSHKGKPHSNDINIQSIQSLCIVGHYIFMNQNFYSLVTFRFV